MTDKPFYQTEKGLWKAKGYYSPKTGELMNLTNAEKMVYMYMLDRVAFFVDELKTLHFESQDTIATALGIGMVFGAKTVVTFLSAGVGDDVSGDPATMDICK